MLSADLIVTKTKGENRVISLYGRDLDYFKTKNSQSMTSPFIRLKSKIRTEI